MIVIAASHRLLFHFAKHTLFRKGFLRWLFLHGGGQVPVVREAVGGNEEALRAAVRAVEQGAAFCVYPEAHRSPDGRMRRGRPGAGRLAYLTGAPCYPVAVQGTYEVWPKGRRLPRLFRGTRVIVGEPRVFPRDARKAEDTPTAQAATDLLMKDLANLIGEPYEPSRAPPPE